MTKINAREFWLDICTPYGDPCDFIHNKDPYEEAKNNNTHAVVSATNIHVIEYSAYEQSQARVKELEVEKAELLKDFIALIKLIDSFKLKNKDLEKMWWKK